MKKTIKNTISVLLSLILCFSFAFSISFPTQAATVDYVKNGSYIYNWGTREEIATFMSPNAEDFYSDNDVTYSELIALSGSSSESNVPTSTLYKELQSLMKENHSYVTSYDATRDRFQYTDCQNSGKTSKKISSFYSGKEIGPSWDGGSTWNREHCWPNSKGNMAGNGENDIMMLRPTSTSENGSRGNKAYGKSSGYYNPNSESGGKHDLRGDVARIVLYQYVRWNCTKASDNKGNWYSVFGTNGVIESIDVMLEWIESDPVDTWELGRNDSVESITGTRNVFVDYPELAFVLFNENIPSDYTTPSGNAANGTSPNPGTPEQPEQPEEPEQPTEPGLVVIDAPKTNTAYKFGMVQGNMNNTIYYLKGGMASTYYLDTTDDDASAINVYLENASGGYHLYTDYTGKKQYINMLTSSDGQHVNAAYESTASTVYTFDSNSKTLVANMTCKDVTEPYWFGTRNDKNYTTVGPCAVSYNGFYCQFYGSKETDDNVDVEESGDKWIINNISTTGAYELTPNQGFGASFKEEYIIVTDNSGAEVKFNTANGGYPFVAGQTYTVVFTKTASGYIVDDISWKVELVTNNLFPDTNADDWYTNAVTYAVGAGIMSGYSNGKFGTSDSIQRQDFLVMLARYEGVNLENYTKKSKFSDVVSGSYYEAAVNWGADMGIVTGYNNGKFGVGDKVTREQLVTFLYRYAQYKNLNVLCTSDQANSVKNTYSDYKNVSSFAQDAIIWAVTKGIITGKTPTTIAPQGNAQRCEVAKIMYNIFINDIF